MHHNDASYHTYETKIMMQQMAFQRGRLQRSKAIFACILLHPREFGRVLGAETGHVAPAPKPHGVRLLRELHDELCIAAELGGEEKGKTKDVVELHVRKVEQNSMWIRPRHLQLVDGCRKPKRKSW